MPIVDSSGGSTLAILFALCVGWNAWRLEFGIMLLLGKLSLNQEWLTTAVT